MKIAVTGATGQLGRLVIEHLKQRVGADTIVALVRSPEKAQDLGVETRRADYGQPDTLQPALAGVDTLLLISSSEVGKRLPQHRNVIEAARHNGIRHLVYTSLLRADTSPLSLAVEHVQTEAEIKASGLTYTLLRNGWYTENYTGALPGAVAAGALVGSAGNGRISSATRDDYALAAAVVLTTPGHEGKTYELAGDEAWTPAMLAAEVSRQLGREIPYRNLPEAEYAKVLEGAGLPAPLAAAIASWDAGAAQGALFDDGRQLSALIGRPTTPLSVSVSRALAQLS